MHRKDIDDLYDIHDKLTDKKILRTITPEEEKKLEELRKKLESQNKDFIDLYQYHIDVYQGILNKIRLIKRDMMEYIDNISTYDNAIIDIDENTVRFNNKELDNESRKNIANKLRSLIPELLYRFKKGIVLNEDERLVVTIPNEMMETEKIDTIKIGDIEIQRRIFKNNYKNVRICHDIKSEEDTWCLMEGYRHIPLEEMHHIIDLIYKPKDTTFYLGLDLF